MGRSPGGGIGNHSSILAWGIPWTEDPGGATVHTESDMTEHIRVGTHTHVQVTFFTCPGEMTVNFSNFSHFASLLKLL